MRVRSAPLPRIVRDKEAPISAYDVRMVVLSTDDLDESIRFYGDTLGMDI